MTGRCLLTLWSGAADQQLLLNILDEHTISVNFEGVAARLGCTPRAVQERLKKLKKMASEQAGGSALAPVTPTKPLAKKKTGEDDTSSSATKKRKVATPKSAKAVNSTKASKAVTGTAADTSDAGQDATEMAQGIKREREDDSHGVLYGLEVGMCSSFRTYRCEVTNSY